jgi:hypothetical protein
MHGGKEKLNATEIWVWKKKKKKEKKRLYYVLTQHLNNNKDRSIFFHAGRVGVGRGEIRVKNRIRR